MAKKKHSKKVRSPLSERFEFVGEAVQAPCDAKVLRVVSAAIGASFSEWLGWAGAGRKGTRDVESTRP